MNRVKSLVYSVFFILFFSSVVLPQEQKDYQNLSMLTLEELLNISVTTAGKQQQKISEIPASVIILTRKEIENYGYKTLDDILSNITGLFLWDTYHSIGKTTVGIRGYTSPGGGNDNTIILLNGVDQIEGVYEHYLLPKIAVPVEAIDRIEVIRGPMSVLYGSGAFFGAINIITNENYEFSSTKITAGFGSENTKKLFFTTGGKFENLSVKFNFGYSSRDGIDIPYSEIMTDPTNLLNFGLPVDARTKSIYKETNTFLNLSANYNNFSFEFIHTQFEKGGVIVVPSLNYSPLKMYSTSAMVKYEKNLSENFTLRGKISYLSNNSLANLEQYTPDSYISFGYNADAYQFEVNALYKPNKNLDITAGIYHKVEYYATNPFEGEAAWGTPYANVLTELTSPKRNNALFLQAVYSPLDKLKLIGGIRFEQLMKYDLQASSGPATVPAGRNVLRGSYNLDEIQVIPRLAAIFSFDKDNIIKFLYGEAFRHPAFGQIADGLLSTADNSSYKAPELKPAKIKTFEINYLFSYRNIFLLNLSVFNNYLYDIFSVKYTTDDNGNVINYATNEGKLETFGFEAGITLRPTDNWEIELSTSYQKSDEITDGFEDMKVPYSPELLFYFKSLYIFNQKYSISANCYYVDEMETDYSRQSKIRIGQKSDAYFMLDANLRINNFIFNNYYFDLKVSNLLDSKIHSPINSVNSFADKGFLLPGREFMMTVGLNF